MRLIVLLCGALLAACAFLSCSGSSFVDLATLQINLDLARMPGQEDYPDADGVYVLDNTDVHMKIEDYNIVTYDTIHRVKKLFKNIESQAVVVISLDENEKLKSIRARTIKADGTPVEVKKEDFLTSYGEGGGEVLYTDRTVIRFTFPAIEKNCYVEYEYKILERRPFVTDIWEIQHDVPTIRNNYTLTVPVILMEQESRGGLNWSWHYKTYAYEGIGKPNITIPVNPEGGTTTQEAIFTWSLSDVPAFESEPSMPSLDRFDGHVKFSPSEWNSWNDVSRWYYGQLFKPRIETDGEIAAKAMELTASCIGDAEKISRIFRYVQSLRYVAIELGLGSIQPTPAATVLERAYGDCKDKSVLLVSLLRSAGISAEPVLVMTQDEGVLDPAFPSWFFNHMIVKAEARGGSTYWLDATVPTCPIVELPWQCEGIDVLVLHQDGTSAIERTPASASSANTTSFFIREDISKSLDARFDVTMKFHGERNFRNREFFRDRTEQEMKEFCKTLVVDDFVGATVGRYSFSNLDSVNADLVFRFDFAVSNALKQQSDLYFLTADPFKLLNEFGWLVKDKRRYPLSFSYPRTIRRDITINYPRDGFAVRNLPADVTQQGDNFDYTQSSRSEAPGTIQVTEEFAVKKREIGPKEYASTKKFFERIQTHNAEKIVFVGK